MSKQYLDKEGLQVVADNTNLKVKIVTEVPLTPRTDMVILYDGTDTADFSKGGIYKYTGTEWEPLGGSVEQVYDATSEKAQSGKAVEQAVEEFIANNTTLVWEDKTWNDFTEFEGKDIWIMDGTVYYSTGIFQKVLNKSTSTWENKTWNGFSNFYASRDLWSDGDNVYISKRAWVADDCQKVLNKSTSTWEDKTWYGLTQFSAEHIWKDGDNIYYSNTTDQYVLNKATSTWEPKTWYGLTNIRGEGIWTDGDNIYYSYSSDQYVLDKSTDTWELKTWNGFTDIMADYIWTDGNNIYYSIYSDQYVLNKATSTWEPISFNVEVIEGREVWHCDDYLYCSVQTTQDYYEHFVAHRKFNTLIK